MQSHQDLSHSEPSGKREQAKAANRAAILKAARLVFAELGVEAATVRDIIRQTDLASGTFYNYFKSKEEIYGALVQDTLIEFTRLLKDMKQEDMSYEDYLRTAFGAYFRFLCQQNEEVFCLDSPIINKPVMRFDTPEMKAVFQEVRKDIESVLQAEGRTKVDTEYLTAAAIGIARELGNCMLIRIATKSCGREHAIDEATEFATHMTLSGVRHSAT